MNNVYYTWKWECKIYLNLFRSSYIRGFVTFILLGEHAICCTDDSFIIRYLVTNFKVVPRGTEGAVSLEGTFAGLLAAITLASAGCLLGDVITFYSPFFSMNFSYSSLARNFLGILCLCFCSFCLFFPEIYYQILSFQTTNSYFLCTVRLDFIII